jgi:chromosome segregation ATPase
LTEYELKRRFVAAANSLLTDKNSVLYDFDAIKAALFDTTALESERSDLQSEMTVVAELIQKCVDENARRKQDQDEYRQRYEGLAARFEAAKKRYTELGELIQERKVRRQATETFLAGISKKAPLTEFDEQFWYATVDFVTVRADGGAYFTFKDGTEVQA